MINYTVCIIEQASNGMVAVLVIQKKRICEVEILMCGYNLYSNFTGILPLNALRI